MNVLCECGNPSYTEHLDKSLCQECYLKAWRQGIIDKEVLTIGIKVPVED